MKRGSTSSSDCLPQIFLSHSGQQKAGFVTPLYHALVGANHLPFFDQDTIDSLRPGEEYPPRILQACRACKVGVIVLSEKYVQSLWPMLELQYLLLSDSKKIIYPLFYQLQPADLSDLDKLARWKECWAEQAAKWQSRMLQVEECMSSNGRELQINLDVKSWAENLGKLQYKKGLVRTLYQSDYDYIQAVVSTICVRLPPPRKYSMGDGIKGVERMQQVVAGAFKQEGSMRAGGVQAVGVHGIGGSGKTTLCEAMANFYSKSFPGRSFCLKFPSDDNDIMNLLRSIGPILKSLSCTEDVSDINQALSLLEGRLKRNTVFLAIDNVWDHSFEYAQRIMLMKCMPESKILVTSGSKKIVTDLLRSRSEDIDMSASEQEDSDMFASEGVQGDVILRHSSVPLRCKTVSVLEIPSLTELEAMEVLRSYSCHSRFIPEDCLRSLARSCFFGEQCHPLCLKLKGTELRRRGRASFDDKKWTSLISGLQDVGVNIGAPAVDNIEQAVLQVVGKSLDGLPSRLQDIFAHMATCEVLAERDVEEIIMLLRLLRYYYDFTGDEMRYQVINKLEYYGLVDIVEERWGEETYERLVIHDLHKQLAKSKVSSAAAACGLCAGLHDFKYSSCWEGEDLSDLSTEKVMSRKHVWGHNVPESTWKAMFPLRCGPRESTRNAMFLLRRRPPPRQAQIRYLHLEGGPNQLIGVGNIKGLRALRLEGDNTTKLKEIEGWEGVPNLVWLELSDLYNLETMGPIACLKKLERLILRHCVSLKLDTIVGTDDRSMSLVRVGDHFPKLQHVDLTYSCKNLVEVGTALSYVFPALKELKLSHCSKLRSFPELKSGSLRFLDLSGCRELREMEGSICSLPALQHLRLNDGTNLESMPDMSNVVSLRSLEMEGGCWWRFVTTTSNANADGETYDRRHQQDNLQAGVEIDHGHPQSQPIELSDALHAGTGICVNVIPLIHLHRLSIEADSARTPLVRLLNLSSLPSLRSVELRSFGSVRKLCFSNSSDQLANLESVSIGDFPCLEEIRGFGAHHTHLSSVSIENCPLLVRTPGLDALPALQALRIIKCLNPSFSVSLRWLKVEDCSSWTDLSSLAALKCLVSLTLDRCTSLKDISGLVADLNTYTTLTQLQMSGCYSLPDVCSLAGLTTLTKLALYGCTALTNVSSLAGLTSLTELRLHDCTALTEVSSTLAGLTSLRMLELYGCTTLTNVSSLAGLTSLRELRFDGCSALTDLSSLAGLKSLRRLRLKSCDSVRELPVLKHLTGLERLFIWQSSCGTLKEGDVRQLVSAKTHVIYWQASESAPIDTLGGAFLEDHRRCPISQALHNYRDLHRNQGGGALGGASTTLLQQGDEQPSSPCMKVACNIIAVCAEFHSMQKMRRQL